MTATMPAIADVSVALRRAAKRYADDAADDPITDELIAVLAEGVRPLLEQPAAGARPGQLQELAADNGRLSDRAAELQQRLETTAGQAAQLRVDNAGLADQLGGAQARIRELAEELAGQGERLGAELKQARGAVAEKTQLLRELDEQHRHLYPWDDPASPPGPCECGKPHPLTQPRPVPPAAEPAPPDPWDRIRNDLKGWPAA